jgi:hypothetical protein
MDLLKQSFVLEQAKPVGVAVNSCQTRHPFSTAFHSRAMFIRHSLDSGFRTKLTEIPRAQAQELSSLTNSSEDVAHQTRTVRTTWGPLQTDLAAFIAS